VSSQTVVVTANVLRDLRTPDARAALREIVELAPDLIGLQEWEVYRLPLLHETGSVALTSPSRPRWRRAGGVTSPHYIWSAAVFGGCVVGARSDRYELLTSFSRLLSRPGRAEREDRPFRWEPPRVAAGAVYFDRLHARRVGFVSYHLASGVQRGGRYDETRPILGGRHRGEIAALQSILAEQRALGHEVLMVGDSNFDGMRLVGLTSAWEGRLDHPGTHGTRKIDDVHGDGDAVDVRLLTNASDHRAVVVTRPDR
jgi:hypothetical protein